MPSKFCAQCGFALVTPQLGACVSCGAFNQDGPSLLVVAGVFAEEHMLMVRRAIPPYVGKWAPPGGYVEFGESVEAAAARELQEEAGLIVPPDEFSVSGVVSLTGMNQVHIVLIAIIEKMEQLRPASAEALEADWFSAATFPRNDVWDPFLSVSVGQIFDHVRSRQFQFIHQTDGSRRIIRTEATLSGCWEEIAPAPDKE